MKVEKVENVNKALLHTFLNSCELTKIQIHSHASYVIEHNDRIIGLFELHDVDEGNYWLKKLFIDRQEALKLPIVLEFILTFAKEKQRKNIYVFSDQPVTDLLLSSLQFSLQQNTIPFPVSNKMKGKWWAYHVS